MASSSSAQSLNKKKKKNHQIDDNDQHVDKGEGEVEGTNDDDEEKLIEFDEMGLDDRLLASIASLGWKSPTLIQEKAIPLALNGKDILARARTGTGKTGAFGIPILHQLLTMKKSSSWTQTTRALILTPSKELSSQTEAHLKSLATFCSREIRIVDVSRGTVDDLKAILIADKPDIVIGTPSRILMHVQGKSLTDLKRDLKHLVVDEADLMFSFGFDDDMKQLLSTCVPKIGCQSFLMSATLNADVQTLKKLMLHNPVVLKLEEPDLPESERLIQYHIQCDEEEKFVLTNALFKLKLIRGRSIIFVRSVDRCYKLKLFLEQFGVSCCILNSELPVTSRCYVVNQYNSGVYDIIIASDETCIEDPTSRKKKNPKSKRKQDKEYGISRGIDFQFVSNIINFDFPTTVKDYVHRVGRAARGDEKSEGTALSLISPAEQKQFDAVRSAFGSNSNFKPYQFKMEELEAFRYRSRDALRAVTSIAVREARIKEIKREMLTSQKLKSYFEEHPKDLKLLKHDKALHTVKHQSHLKDVPDYIVPPTLQAMVKSTSKRSAKIIEEEASLTLSSSRPKRRRNATPNKSAKQNDPLRTFRFEGVKKSHKRKKK